MFKINTYIENEQDLKKLCSRLKRNKYIVIDTEFVREKFYHPKVGLIQIATEKLSFIIDPIKIKDLSSFVDILNDRDVLKVFHACREDLAVFYTIFKIIPSPIFDTQIAAAFAGFEEQTSYAKLVKAIADVSLDKNETRTDWLKRPLTDKQIEYALDDVRYLPKVYKHLERKLKKLNRLEWANEEFADTESIDNYEPKDIEIQYSRTVNAPDLTSRARYTLVKLLSWRDEKARSLDKLRKDIVKDDILICIAKKAPTSLGNLYKIPDFFWKDIKIYGEEIINIVKKEKTKTRYYRNIKKEHPIPSGLVNLLTAFIKKKTGDENIAYGIVATREDIEKFIGYYFAGEVERSSFMKGWRHDFIGHDLIKIMEGRVNVGFSPDKKEIFLVNLTKSGDN